MICPYCKEGKVWRVHIKYSRIFECLMCLECDTVWTVAETVKDSLGQGFKIFMQKNGLLADWSLIEKIEELK